MGMGMGWLARWEGEDPTIMPFAAPGSQKPQLDFVEAARSHVRTSWKYEQEHDPICDRIEDDNYVVPRSCLVSSDGMGGW
jgi:hypothetical protein